jgi:O-antigen ligase
MTRWKDDKIAVEVWLVVVGMRPVMDATWFLKNTDIGFSPLQVLGAGLPAFFVWALWRRRDGLAFMLKSHWDVLLWGLLLLVAGVSALVVQPDSESAGVALKFVLPPLLLLFGFLYVRDAATVRRLAWVLLLAGVVPVLFILYELIAGPMSTSLRSGVERYIGPYAQVSVYGIHFSLALMGAGYLAVSSRKRWPFVALLLLIAVLAVSAAFVVHMSTWAVLLGITALILFFLLRGREWTRAALVAVCALTFTTAGFLLRPDQQYERIYAPDVEVISGDRDLTNFGNARGFIWRTNLETFASLPVIAQIFGSSLSGRNHFGATAFGAHNDFLRILLATGIIGLLAYLVWLGRTLFRVFRLKGEQQFMGLAALLILLGYSVALSATYIMPLVTALLPILGAVGANHRDRNDELP